MNVGGTRSSRMQCAPVVLFVLRFPDYGALQLAHPVSRLGHGMEHNPPLMIIPECGLLGLRVTLRPPHLC